MLVRPLAHCVLPGYMSLFGLCTNLPNRPLQVQSAQQCIDTFRLLKYIPSNQIAPGFSESEVPRRESMNVLHAM